MDEQKFKVGVLKIDVFDKFMHVVPIKSKQEGDVASGMVECSNKIDKKPQIIYTDDEGDLNKEAIQKYIKDENIEHHRTRGHPNFLKEPSAHLKICCIGELKRIRKRESKTSNGQITY